MIKRIRQLYKAIRAGITAEDESFINEYLTLDERKLFDTMAVYDKRHALNVAASAAKLVRQYQITVNFRLMMKAALLHDIGRTADTVILSDKILLVLLEMLPPKLQHFIAKDKCQGFIGRRRQALYRCMHHAFIGAVKLRKIGALDVAAVVERHHNKPDDNDDSELVVLRKADEAN
ncbi:HDIG domain-containing metalloprotein [Pectinatus frisingensis]|uniref:HDIG domain-containing metalloprotein n=1 Tax=Pectinatus frisingensis TaxID=865 RepID=UPI0015F3D9D9|nr:HDIG domain-containing metalloprotein [Pectinatus frisingensis]